MVKAPGDSGVVSSNLPLQPGMTIFCGFWDRHPHHRYMNQRVPWKAGFTMLYCTYSKVMGFPYRSHLRKHADGP